MHAKVGCAQSLHTNSTAWMISPKVVATNSAEDRASPAPSMSCVLSLSATKLQPSKRPHQGPDAAAVLVPDGLAEPHLTVVIVIAVKTYVNKLKINIVGPRAASSNVPVYCTPSRRQSRNFKTTFMPGHVQTVVMPDT